MQDQNVATRLKFFIDSEGISSSQFADACGIPRPSLSQLLTGRNKKISNTFLEQVHSTFPQLSVMWLVFGEGEMLVNSDDDSVTESEVLRTGEEVTPPYGTKTAYKSNIYLTNQDQKLDATTSERIKMLERDNMELRAELESLKGKKRKVSSITVYYDDSTFETFEPRK